MKNFSFFSKGSKKTKKSIAAFFVFLCLAINSLGCYAAEDGEKEIQSLDEVKKLEYVEGAVDDGQDAINQRATAQKEAAMSIGAQVSYKKHLTAIKKRIVEHEAELDAVFDFTTLMKYTSPNNQQGLYFLPPVIKIIDDPINLSDDAKTITFAEKEYQIVKEEHLVPSPPNWRQYLLFDRKVDVSKPANVLLPKNSEEKINWERWSKLGWEAGKIQADREMKRRIERLGSDFTGMLTYVRLMLENKVNKPTLSSEYQSIKGGGKQMTIGERTISVHTTTELNAEPDDWDALIMDSRGSYRNKIESSNYNKGVFQ